MSHEGTLFTISEPCTSTLITYCVCRPSELPKIRFRGLKTLVARCTEQGHLKDLEGQDIISVLNQISNEVKELPLRDLTPESIEAQRVSAIIHELQRKKQSVIHSDDFKRRHPECTEASRLSEEVRFKQHHLQIRSTSCLLDLASNLSCGHPHKAFQCSGF